MITRIYWVLRILGFVVTLGAAIVFLNVRYTDPVMAERAKLFLGIGFLCFATSAVIYVVRRSLRRH